ALRVAQARAAGRRPMLAWFWPRALAGELGRPSGQGLARLGLDPAGLLIVETAREVEAMLALEEGLKSGSLVLAIGVVKSVEINPARRLSLAAGAHKTPCLLLTHPASGAAASSATRWRIARAPSAPHPFDARAPGAMRFSVALERCRARPQSANLSPLLVEWCDETLRFGMAAELADDASGARRAASGAAR
ncbi:MAG: hypothetical protein ABL907_00155, partial [Hyphomicrobium sp.]